MIETVTITGADDSVAVKDLLILAENFPFVEWAILVMPKRYGTKRFPSLEWLNELSLYDYEKINLSLHLCGNYVNQILIGDDSFIRDFGFEILDMFNRVQINTHGRKHEFNLKMLIDFLKSRPEKEIIIQYDGTNHDMLMNLHSAVGSQVSTLFDMSHGAGVLPEKGWPLPLHSVKCGYAGGISPDNITEQILAINAKVEDTETWIDMETHVRSNDDKQFDLAKVRKCLQLSSKHIKSFGQ